jgi:hypothetical protein
MFIYLDNAHFSALEDLLTRDPTAFAGFLEFWIEHHCKLIVSRAHLHEIGQRENVRDVEKRLELLRYFPICSGHKDENVDWVIIHEIRSQALHRLQSDGDVASPPYLPLREELYRPTSISALADWLRYNRPYLLQEMHSRREMAGFENSSLKFRKYVRKVTKQEPKWHPNAWKMMPIVKSLAPDISGDPLGDRYKASVEHRMRECYKNAKSERQALLCVYGLDGFACATKAPKQDLSRLGFYRTLAQHWVPPYCWYSGYDPEAVRAVLDQLDLYDAPGISAALAVERGRKLQDKDWEAGDFMDVDHILWSAHADLAFVDKRTLGFILQARRNSDTAKLLSPHLKVQYERTTNLEDVKKHIATLRSERSRPLD